jgi:hypothetical protein
MICPVCGTTMNHHADKLDYSVIGAAESGLGGIVQQIHTCPGCGNVETQVADGATGPTRGSGPS